MFLGLQGSPLLHLFLPAPVTLGGVGQGWQRGVEERTGQKVGRRHSAHGSVREGPGAPAGSGTAGGQHHGRSASPRAAETSPDVPFWAI